MIVLVWGDFTVRARHRPEIERALMDLTDEGDLILLGGGRECDRQVLWVAGGIRRRVVELGVCLPAGDELEGIEYARLVVARTAFAAGVADRGIYFGDASRKHDAGNRPTAARLVTRGIRPAVVRLGAPYVARRASR